MSADRHELERRVSAVMDELNSLGSACGELETAEGLGAKDRLGKAWSNAYDARISLRQAPMF